MQAAGLPSDQAWATLTIEQLQAPTRMPAMLKTGRLKLYRYTSKDIWGYRDPDGSDCCCTSPATLRPCTLFDRFRAIAPMGCEAGQA